MTTEKLLEENDKRELEQKYLNRNTSEKTYKMKEDFHFQEHHLTNTCDELEMILHQPMIFCSHKQSCSERK